MSGPEPPKGTQRPPSAEDLEDPFVKKVKQSIGELFGSAIEGMSKDMDALLQTNGASHTHEASRRFTIEMLRMLAERVRGTLPPVWTARQGAAEHPDAESPAAQTTDRRDE